MIAEQLHGDLCQHASGAVSASLKRAFRGEPRRVYPEAGALLRQLTEDYIVEVLQIIEQHGLWLSGEVGRALPGAVRGSWLNPNLTGLLSGE
jgi:hypothetical protein